MSAVARALGDRAKSRLTSRLRSLTDAALAGHTEREAEILHQLTDVFGELRRLSAEMSVLRSGIGEMNARLQQLVAGIDDSIEIHQQTTQLLGRLLESVRGRLEVLEEATSGTK